MSDEVAVITHVCLIDDEEPEKGIFEQYDEAQQAYDEAKREYEESLERSRDYEAGIERLEEQIREHEAHFFNRDGKYPGFYKDESHLVAWLYTEERHAEWKQERDRLQENLDYIRERAALLEEELRAAERKLEEAGKKLRELRKQVEERQMLDSLLRKIQRMWARWWKRLLAMLGILGAILLLVAAGYTVAKNDPAPPKPAVSENIPAAPVEQKAPPAESGRGSPPGGSDSGPADAPPPAPAGSGPAVPGDAPAPASGSGPAEVPGDAPGSGPAPDPADPGPLPAPASGSGPVEAPAPGPAENPGPAPAETGGGQQDSAPAHPQPGESRIPDVNIPGLGGGATDGYVPGTVPSAESPGQAEIPGLGSAPGAKAGEGQQNGTSGQPGESRIPGVNIPGLGGDSNGYVPGTLPGAGTGTQPNSGTTGGRDASESGQVGGNPFLGTPKR